MQKLRSIQVLRGVAALAVVLCHARLMPQGAVGVDLFFVISGFIIATIAPGRSAAQFIIDRAWRIYPPYLIASVPWFLLAAHLGMTSTERTLSSLTLWPIYSAYANPYLRVAWSLCFEMLFYVAAAVAILGNARWPLIAFAGCFLANLLWPTPLLAFLGSPLIFEFLAGVAITRIRRSEAAAVPALAIALVALALAPVFDQLGLAQPMSRIVLWGVPSALIVYAALSLERVVTRWAEAFVKLGDASYSLYLWHIGICAIFPAWVAVPASVAAGLAGYRYIESPLLRWRHGRTALVCPAVQVPSVRTVPVVQVPPPTLS